MRQAGSFAASTLPICHHSCAWSWPRLPRRHQCWCAACLQDLKGRALADLVPAWCLKRRSRGSPSAPCEQPAWLRAWTPALTGKSILLAFWAPRSRFLDQPDIDRLDHSDRALRPWGRRGKALPGWWRRPRAAPPPCQPDRLSIGAQWSLPSIGGSSRSPPACRYHRRIWPPDALRSLLAIPACSLSCSRGECRQGNPAHATRVHRGKWPAAKRSG